MLKHTLDNDGFVTENFEKIVLKYGGKTIAISNKEIFTGHDALEKAEKKYPKITAMLFPVPRKEMFIHGFLL